MDCATYCFPVKCVDIDTDPSCCIPFGGCQELTIVVDKLLSNCDDTSYTDSSGVGSAVYYLVSANGLALVPFLLKEAANVLYNKLGL